jgi:hypothetical protein
LEAPKGSGASALEPVGSAEGEATGRNATTVSDRASDRSMQFLDWSGQHRNDRPARHANSAFVRPSDVSTAKIFGRSPS